MLTFISHIAMLSARNQLPAKGASITLSNVMTKVVMKVGDVELFAAIPRQSTVSLGTKVSNTQTAIIKSTEMRLDKS